MLFSQRIVYYMCQSRLLKIIFVCTLAKSLIAWINQTFIYISFIQKGWNRQSRIEHLCGILYKSLHHSYMGFLSLSHLIFPFDFWNSHHDNTDYIRRNRRRTSPSLQSSTEVPLAISPNTCNYNSLSRTWQCGKNVLKFKFENKFLFFPPKEYCTQILK